MDIGVDFNTVFQMVQTLVLGLMAWALGELYKDHKARNAKVESRVEEILHIINQNKTESFKVFVTRDDHYRDINAIELKVDGIKDMLIDIKGDIGKLIGITKGADKSGQ